MRRLLAPPSAPAPDGVPIEAVLATPVLLEALPLDVLVPLLDRCAVEHDRITTVERLWTARDPQRVRPVSGANCNRLVAVLRRAYTLGKEKLDLTTPLTFPHYAERRRGEYLTEDQCRAICAQFQAKAGAAVKADVFRFAYLTGIRKGQLARTRKRHVLIAGETWKLRWPGEETKNGEPHELVLVGEELEIVQRAWAKRLPDCDFLFHVNGKRLGPMISELRRTCAALGIPYGRRTGVVFHDTRHSAVPTSWRPGRVKRRRCRSPATPIRPSSSGTTSAATPCRRRPQNVAPPIWRLSAGRRRAFPRLPTRNDRSP